MRTFNATPGHICKLCDKAFVEGEQVVLISIGPSDAEEAEKKAAGKAYTSEAVVSHVEHIREFLLG